MKKSLPFLFCLVLFLAVTNRSYAFSFTDSFTAPDNTLLSIYNPNYTQIDGPATPYILSNQVTENFDYWIATYPINLSTIKVCIDSTNALEMLGFQTSTASIYGYATGSSGSGHANLTIGSNNYTSSEIYDNSGTHRYCVNYDGSTVSLLRDNISIISRQLFSIGTINSILFGAHNYTSYGWTNPVSTIDNLSIENFTAPTNTNPQIGTISASVNPIQVNSLAAVSATFTDTNSTDTHTAVWNWGDGTTSIGTVTESNGSGSVSDNHTYTNAGVYTITLTITDNSGGVGSKTFEYLSVYNPTAQGLFTAGQRFNSPTGAYFQQPNLTGNVKFGLSYKYQSTMPTGVRQFMMDFKAANFKFNATSVSSLVASNGFATLSGTGTINEQGNYNFLVTGVDDAGIRIQITDPANNDAIIYDTQPGAAATAIPTTPVDGQIIVHN